MWKKILWNLLYFKRIMSLKCDNLFLANLNLCNPIMLKLHGWCWFELFMRFIIEILSLSHHHPPVKYSVWCGGKGLFWTLFFRSIPTLFIFAWNCVTILELVHTLIITINLLHFLYPVCNGEECCQITQTDLNLLWLLLSQADIWTSMHPQDLIVVLINVFMEKLDWNDFNRVTSAVCAMVSSTTIDNNTQQQYNHVHNLKKLWCECSVSR